MRYSPPVIDRVELGEVEVPDFGWSGGRVGAHAPLVIIMAAWYQRTPLMAPCHHMMV